MNPDAPLLKIGECTERFPFIILTLVMCIF